MGERRLLTLSLSLSLSLLCLFAFALAYACVLALQIEDEAIKLRIRKDGVKKGKDTVGVEMLKERIVDSKGKLVGYGLYGF